MLDRTEAVTLNLVGLALDAASLRQQAIATNIANATTANYRPLRVSFEDQLDAARQSLNLGQPVSAGSLADVKPVQLRDLPRQDGDGTASLDMETAKLAENAVHYQALLKGLSKHMAIMSTVISEGKR